MSVFAKIRALVFRIGWAKYANSETCLVFSTIARKSSSDNVFMGDLHKLMTELMLLIGSSWLPICVST